MLQLHNNMNNCTPVNIMSNILSLNFPTEKMCKTRDIFSARLQSYVTENKKWLEAAIIGEIGNNTFDHNFTYAADHPRGLYCDFNYMDTCIVLADFGRGIRSSLEEVISVDSDIEAMEIAFTKRISGRAPEQRGNGLKFVKQTIIENNWYLYYQSGSGCCKIDNKVITFFESEKYFTGCFAIVCF
jgi:hypothetical protein